MKQTKIFETEDIKDLEKQVNRYIAEELENQESVIDIKMSTWACQGPYHNLAYTYQAMIIYDKKI